MLLRAGSKIKLLQCIDSEEEEAGRSLATSAATDVRANAMLYFVFALFTVVLGSVLYTR